MADAKYIPALDQVTTCSRAMVIDARGTVLALATPPFAQHFSKPG